MTRNLVLSCMHAGTGAQHDSPGVHWVHFPFLQRLHVFLRPRAQPPCTTHSLSFFFCMHRPSNITIHSFLHILHWRILHTQAHFCTGSESPSAHLGCFGCLLLFHWLQVLLRLRTQHSSHLRIQLSANCGTLRPFQAAGQLAQEDGAVQVVPVGNCRRHHRSDFRLRVS